MWRAVPYVILAVAAAIVVFGLVEGVAALQRMTQP